MNVYDPKFLKIEETIMSIVSYLTLHKKHKVQRIIEASRNTVEGRGPAKRGSNTQPYAAQVTDILQAGKRPTVFSFLVLLAMLCSFKAHLGFVSVASVASVGSPCLPSPPSPWQSLS